MPDFVWKMLLRQASWCNDTSPPATSSPSSFKKGRSHVPWSVQVIGTKGASRRGRGAELRVDSRWAMSWRELVGEDATMRRSLEQVLALSEHELAALNLDFVGAEATWNIASQRLELTEVRRRDNCCFLLTCTVTGPAGALRAYTGASSPRH